MPRIEIESTQIKERSGKSERTGREYNIREQQALLFKAGSRYPDKIKITLDEDARPYPVGVYELDDESFYPSRYGSLEVRPVLVPVAAAVKAAS
jgi:hypothetical protein